MILLNKTVILTFLVRDPNRTEDQSREKRGICRALTGWLQAVLLLLWPTGRNGRGVYAVGLVYMVDHTRICCACTCGSQ